MKLDEFLKKLAAVSKRRGWKTTTENNLLRLSVKRSNRTLHCCPVTAVCLAESRKFFGDWDFIEAAKRIKLSTQTAKRIALAADINKEGKLRRRLERIMFGTAVVLITCYYVGQTFVCVA